MGEGLLRQIARRVSRRDAPLPQRAVAHLLPNPLPPGLTGIGHVFGTLQTELPAALGECRMFGDNHVGAFTYINHNGEIANTRLGRYCSVGQQVLINPGEHPRDWLSTHPFVSDPSGISCGMAGWPEYAAIACVRVGRTNRPEVGLIADIGNDVWIGARATILGGVKIGDGAIIAANAVVTRDVPPFMIAAGIPARVLRPRLAPEMVERLRALAWWDYDLSAARDLLDYSNVEDSVSQLEAMVQSGRLQRLAPRVATVSSGAVQSVTDAPGA